MVSSNGPATKLGTCSKYVAGTSAVTKQQIPNATCSLQIGEFQCYDRRALASLAQAARDAGHPDWGYGGPHDAGSYNSLPEVSPTGSHWLPILATSALCLALTQS